MILCISDIKSSNGTLSFVFNAICKLRFAAAPFDIFGEFLQKTETKWFFKDYASPAVCRE